MEQTLILVKPDGVQRGLIGEIIGRFERRGLKLRGMKFLQMSDALANQHYAVHRERKDAIAAARSTMGATNPVAAAPGTIRGDLGMEIGRNLVHGSDSPENGIKEVALFFTGAELVEWSRSNEGWIRE
jgi:nucleoside-diphosphate kinase